MTSTGLIAILRGVTPPEVLSLAKVLVEAGFTGIEVPLNSPDPFTSVHRLAETYGDDVLVGAGTVLTAPDVRRATGAGARVIVAPNTDSDVITAAVKAGLRPYPGVATPTEAFSAIAAGARSLKLFPSEAVGIAGMRAWRAVLPPDVELLPVGGLDASNLGDWAAAGAGGAGLGTCLYRPGDGPEEVGERAEALVRAWEDGGS
jgi:2-dehydro-3-deoxyphosphogalactonate aldolase